MPDSDSLRLSRFIADATADDLTPAAIANAKRSLLDTIGVVLAASAAPEPQPFIRRAEARPDPSGATVLGRGFRADLEAAVAANGAMVHVLDYEDAHDEALVHPTAAPIPVALALAEVDGGVHGRDLLTAIALGCEVTTRLSTAFTTAPEEGRWYRPSLLGVFGGVAAAAHLRGLAPEAVRDALSIALCRTVACSEMARSPRSELRAIRDAWSAAGAVEAVDLVERGLVAFDHPIEGDAGLYAQYGGGGYDRDRLLDGLGVRWAIEDLGYKPWPSCRATHAPVEAVISLAAAHDLRPADVDSIVVATAPVNRMVVEPVAQRLAPTTPIDAKFSLPWTCAIALVDRALGLRSFDRARLADPEVQALAHRVVFRPREDLGPTQADVTITTATGHTHRQTVMAVSGSAARPLAWPQLVDKYRECAALAHQAPTPGQVEAIEQVVDTAESVDGIGPVLADLLDQPRVRT